METNSDPTLAAQGWQTGEPPYDREIILIGNIVTDYGDQVSAESFLSRAVFDGDTWIDPTSGFPIKENWSAELVIHAWIDLPYNAEFLIAAERELLAVMKDVEKWMTALAAQGVLLRSHMKLLTDARHAIAKVEGRAR